MSEYYRQPFNNTVPELVKVSNWPEGLSDINAIKSTQDEILTNVQELAATTEAIDGQLETNGNQLLAANTTLTSLNDLLGLVNNAQTTISNSLVSIDNDQATASKQDTQTTSLQNTEAKTAALAASVGTPADSTSTNTVIGLLKSIKYKLSN